MSDLTPDVSKMKVAELRAALLERGLDTKGVKLVLQERLSDALENEDSPAPEGVGEEVEGEDEVNSEESVDEIAEEATEIPEEDDSEEQQQEKVVEQVEPELTEGPPAELMEEDQTEAQVPKEKESIVKDEPVIKQEETEPMQSEETPAAADESVQAEVKGEDTTEVKEEVKDEDKDTVKKEENDKDDDKDSKKSGKESKHDEKEDRDREKRGDRDRGHRDRRDRSPRRRSPSPVVMEEDDDIPETQCVLSKYISDLNMKVAKEGYSAAPLSNDGFAFLWSGVKATHGANKGKVCYEVKLVEHQNVKHLPSEEKNPHVVRVGWSLNKSTLQLGEEAFSYGFGGTGKFSVKCKFSNFGETFGEGDVITAYLDLDAEQPTVSYAKNGKDLGVAHTIAEDLKGAALFPHLLVKNTSVEINFGQKEETFFPITEGYTLIGSLPQDDQVRGPIPPVAKKDCEIIMMVGLPGAGKTTWAEKFCEDHPDKKYYILGTNLIMEKMKVMGLRRQRNYAGRFESLIDKSTKCLNRFFEIAARKKRHYVLDQTNVYPSARRRKMRPFEGFESKAIVLVPTDEEFKKRIEKRTKEEGKDVPDHAVLEMKANFELPEKGVLFNEVEYVELVSDEAKPLVDKYRKEGQDKLGPNYKRFSRDRNRGGNRDRSRNDKSPRGGYGNYGGNRGGYNSNRGGGYSSNYGGGGYKDNRNKGRDSNSGYGSGYGSNQSGYGGRQGYGSSYSSQGSGNNQGRNSNYNQSGSGYGSGYGRNYSSGSSTPSSYSSQGYSSGYDNQGYQNQQYQQQYAQYQQQYQQYYQQQNQSYSPYANYYSNYNSGGNSGYGR